MVNFVPLTIRIGPEKQQCDIPGKYGDLKCTTWNRDIFHF